MAWAEAYLGTKWYLDPSIRLANKWTEIWGQCPLFFGGGELSPHLTQCRLVGGLPPYQWHLNPYSRLATTDMGRKLAGGLCPLFFLGEAGAPFLTQCDRGQDKDRQKNGPIRFWATVCKTVRPMLSDRCPVLSCVSVTLVWPNGWIDQDETWRAGRPRPWPVVPVQYIVLDGWGPSSPSRKSLK